MAWLSPLRVLLLIFRVERGQRRAAGSSQDDPWLAFVSGWGSANDDAAVLASCNQGVWARGTPIEGGTVSESNNPTLERRSWRVNRIARHALFLVVLLDIEIVPR